MSSAHTPTRIVSLQPSATVILKEVGCLDRIVACTKYCRDVCPEISVTNPIILADSWTAEAAPIIAARPDLVIAAVPYQEKAVAEILKACARFLGLAPKCLEDIYTDIAIIAGAVGASARGETVIADMQREIEAIRAQTPATPRPRVFCKNGASRSSPPSAGSPNSWRPPVEASSVSPANSIPPTRYDPPIPKSSSPPGAGQATASLWQKSSATATGKTPPPRSTIAFSAFATNISTPRPPL